MCLRALFDPHHARRLRLLDFRQPRRHQCGWRNRVPCRSRARRSPARPAAGTAAGREAVPGAFLWAPPDWISRSSSFRRECTGCTGRSRAVSRGRSDEGGRARGQEPYQSFGGLQALSDVSFSTTPGEVLGVIPAERCREDDTFQPDRRGDCRIARPSGFSREDVTGHSTDEIARLGLVRTFQRLRSFAKRLCWRICGEVPFSGGSVSRVGFQERERLGIKPGCASEG